MYSYYLLFIIYYLLYKINITFSTSIGSSLVL